MEHPRSEWADGDRPYGGDRCRRMQLPVASVECSFRGLVVVALLDEHEAPVPDALAGRMLAPVRAGTAHLSRFTGSGQRFGS